MFQPTNGVAFNLKEDLLGELDKRLNLNALRRNRTYAVATILDPRFRKLPFKEDKIAASNAVSEISKRFSPR